jgi:branched-chain amino acid aminotransferase
MSKRVYLNDKLIDAEQAQVSVTDSGFLYGAGLFETMRANHGRAFCLADHLERLLSSAVTFSIVHTYDAESLTDAVYETLTANKLTDARLRLTLTGGPMTSDPQQCRATLLITAAEFVPYPAEYYDTGVTVVLCPYRQNPADPTCGHKTTSYCSRLIALNAAHQKQAAEALWFTPDNRLAEGCVSNVFLVRDGVVYTPPVETPVLPGIARKTVCRIIRADSGELVEKDLTIDDVLAADEIFLTNVIMEVLPVVSVEKHMVGTGKVGSLTSRLRAEFLHEIETQCRR